MRSADQAKGVLLRDWHKKVFSYPTPGGDAQVTPALREIPMKQQHDIQAYQEIAKKGRCGAI